MKDLLLYIARSLVEHPDDVTVTEVQGTDELTLELRVNPDDMGKVIGRQGRIAKEIRTIVRAYAQRTGVKVSVDIVD
ncbi:MAG: KH domain-containing protein [Oscillospiraceae bacterium]|nr:KH domain-containing protein [Oscillospiraceae bacterium]